MLCPSPAMWRAVEYVIVQTCKYCLYNCIILSSLCIMLLHCRLWYVKVQFSDAIADTAIGYCVESVSSVQFFCLKALKCQNPQILNRKCNLFAASMQFIVPQCNLTFICLSAI